jgi:hypothetical protein
MEHTDSERHHLHWRRCERGRLVCASRRDGISRAEQAAGNACNAAREPTKGLDCQQLKRIALELITVITIITIHRSLATYQQLELQAITNSRAPSPCCL